MKHFLNIIVYGLYYTWPYQYFTTSCMIVGYYNHRPMLETRQIKKKKHPLEGQKICAFGQYFHLQDLGLLYNGGVDRKLRPMWGFRKLCHTLFSMTYATSFSSIL